MHMYICEEKKRERDGGREEERRGEREREREKYFSRGVYIYKYIFN